MLGARSAHGLGILLSLVAHTEFQVLQFMPTVIAPEVILGGTFVPVEWLPISLEWPGRAKPVTYLLQAMEYVVLDRGTTGKLRTAVVALGTFTVVVVGIAGLVVRRAD